MLLDLIPQRITWSASVWAFFEHDISRPALIDETRVIWVRRRECTMQETIFGEAESSVFESGYVLIISNCGG